MKNLFVLLLSMGAISAHAEVLLKCKPTGMDAHSPNLIQIIFDDGVDFGHPLEIHASLIGVDKSTLLSFSNKQDDAEGFFLIDKKTKRNYHVSRETPRSAITVLCTEPKSLGMMLPCSGDTEFKCRRVTEF